MSTQQQPHAIIPSLRSSSRLLVRELGFMSTTAAGTAYSPSAVHAIIEIGLNDPQVCSANQPTNGNRFPIVGDGVRMMGTGGMTAATLCTELNLEKSSVSRLLKKLVEAGEIKEGFGDDAREKVLRLTEKGWMTLGGIDVRSSFSSSPTSNCLLYYMAWGEESIMAAFEKLPPTATPDDILKGISTYAHALRASRLNTTIQPPSLPTPPVTPPTPLTLTTGYQPGLMARCLTMHMATYSRFNFGVPFESMLSTTLGELLPRLDGITSQVFTAVSSSTSSSLSSSCPGNQIVGMLFMDGHSLSGPPIPGHEYLSAVNASNTNSDSAIKSKVHLRGFVVDEKTRGSGIGGQLLDAALEWADERGFEEVHLWTFRQLEVARRMYERRSFGIVDECVRSLWEGEGKSLVVGHFVRVRGGGKV
ncbi:hypothetical protein VTL71DRAFT_11774 [Oculimacula yallundae]|uniref:N-acetyltransferase domain-containing protein n=1 Tax=Oculimacula yallundae TaxID=86028 RepID=A0ABR4CR28_9HELO